MRCAFLVLLAVALAPAIASEPPARNAVEVPLRLDAALAHVSAVGQLPDGRVVISDAVTPAVSLLDPGTGQLTRLGSPGVNTDQYVQPGGLYGGKDGSLLLLDRAQLRVMAIDPAGTFSGTYSTAIVGTTMSTSADADWQRLDARGFAYFPDRQSMLDRRTPGQPATTMPLVRFDPATQHRTVVAELAQPETRVVDRGGGLTVSRGVIGSPADDWGVAPDGSVAVVRASPYRVDWIAPAGGVVRGPVIAVDEIPMTEADKAAFLATSPAGPSTGGAGTADGPSGLPPEFAPTKAPFTRGDVVVSPDSQVWVLRSRPAGVRDVIYDVFDRSGRRIDRLAFPDGSRVVGFGEGVVFVRQAPATGQVALTRYERK